jgi:formylglycine-generating enzyme required for sulfatase activity
MHKIFLVFLCFPLLMTAQSVDTINIPGTKVEFTMANLEGGTFKMGEGGQKVTISPFAIATHEVTHDAYRLFARRDNDSDESTAEDYSADAVTRPSPPYLDFTYGMGTRGGYPQVNTTQQAALHYCEWLYQKTGHFFRLPTEAEWEYACLAGETEARTPTEDEAWLSENGEEVFHKTGQKKPNAWGLYDMIGNVSEWTLDDYAADYFTRIEAFIQDPWLVPTRKHSRAVRGGHFDTYTKEAGCRIREKSSAKWQARDPQIPKSKWWNVDSEFLSFRLLSPTIQPNKEQATHFFTKAIID